jgi:hypothetical protein
MKKSGDEARKDELGKDPAQVGPRSASQSGRAQSLLHIRDSGEESPEELADTNQSWESSAVESSEDAAAHPERLTHIHEEYGRPDDVPPKSRRPARIMLRKDHRLFSCKLERETGNLKLETTQITTASRYSPNTRRIVSEISPTVA